MRRLFTFVLLAWTSTASAAYADDFDYFVLSLSWSPNWCAVEGDARGSDQCEARHDHGWILHGLWPQYEQGYPAYCQTSNKPPSRRMTREMADIMGTSGLAWHQWKKHGSCTGIAAQQYFKLSRRAYNSIKRPEVLRRVTDEIRVSPKVIEQAFLRANPSLRPEQVTITCRQGHIQEARICLTRSLKPRACGSDVRRDCSASTAIFSPVR